MFSRIIVAQACYLASSVGFVGRVVHEVSSHMMGGTRHAKFATQYVGLVHLGQPSQELRVVFDTSSGQLIVPGSDCGDPSCVSHRKYLSKNSTSAVEIGWADEPTTPLAADDPRDTKSLTFLGGEAAGEFVRDQVCVGAQGFCGVADFIALKESPGEGFSNLEFDGVLGLALTSPDANEFNVLSALLGSKPPASQVFGLYLSLGSTSSFGNGELLFGGVREELLASSVAWANISAGGLWEIQVDDVIVGGKPSNVCGHTGCKAVVDTGASLLLAPGALLATLFEKLGIDDDCNTQAPSIGFIVDGQHLEIPSSEFVRQEENGCKLLLGRAGGGSAWVLGYPFLRQFYTIFDMQKRRVGFASANHTRFAQGLESRVAAVQLVGGSP